MKPKRFYFRTTSIFGTPLKCGAPLFIGFTVLISGLDAQGGDILRSGGSSALNKPGRAAAGAPTPAASAAARANAKDTLARTTRTLDAMRAMQNAARNAAIKNGTNHLGRNPNNLTVPLPKVPNGLITGGLKLAPTVPSDPTKWIGAKLPTQTVKKGKTKVTIQQTEQQALLNWETFNVGKKTTVTFDQTKGGADVGKWIAFNKISDPTGNPTQILGNIKADGQVYLINPNGIIFGGSSQVNARGLTASSLPINDNLVNQGLLNNRDVQFLFSGLSVPGGSDGTPDFNPEPPPALTGKFGDIIVQEGAILKTPSDSAGNGGRVVLVGPNVTNKGSISTESGQTILAAGLQVGVAAHDGSDPSLRGLDVWVGDVGQYAGTVKNSGIIEALTGSVSVTGKRIDQLGVIESSTSVNLNGRIDLKASYGAVSNPNSDGSTTTNIPIFFNQFTGIVTMGEGSVTRILPDYASKKAVPGTALPERSQVNIEGLAIHFEKESTLFAPNAEVSLRAGTWPYKDEDGNRTIFGPTGAVEPGLVNYFTGSVQNFFFDKGQIYLDKAATINVAGSVDVFVPLAHSILTVELRGNELADSPLQRDSKLRGAALTVDIRNTGTYNGKYWIGTPLGDVVGLAGLIEKNVAQLTAVGGNISMQAGESIVLRGKSTLDVSGGYFSHEAGPANTSFLIKGGRLVPIKDATPDQIYDGVFTGKSTFSSEKWGVSKTFDLPLLGDTKGAESVEGAAGGTLKLTAPSMAIDGEMRGITVEGSRQRATPPAASSIEIRFENERSIVTSGVITRTITNSPTPPDIQFVRDAGMAEVPEFSWANDAPMALPQDRLDTVLLSEDLLDDEGFGSLSVYNPDGSITVPRQVTLETAPQGSITLAAANMTVLGSVMAPGGKLNFTTYNISPSFAAEFEALNRRGLELLPTPVAGRGLFILGEGALLSTAGRIADDRDRGSSPIGEPIVTAGGEISVSSFSADLRNTSVIDVSGGVFVSDRSAKTYGKGGSILISTGNDFGLPGVLAGTLSLKSTLKAYSGSTGGSLALQAGLIDVGGTGGAGSLHLSEGFFRQGGFTKYSLAGIGARSTQAPPAGQFESYIPAISIAKGTRIRPLAESLIAEENPENVSEILLRCFVNKDGLRSPVSLSFTALGSDDPFTTESLEIRGDLFMSEDSSIATEAGAAVSFKGQTVTLLGSVTAPGGKISVSGANSFPLVGAQRQVVTQALPTVHLGNRSKLSVAGTVVLKPDAFGRRVGTVYGGGTISVAGNILAEEGALLDASGTSGLLDLDAESLASRSSGKIALGAITSGLTTAPIQIRGIETRVDSSGGMIDLSGSQMLLSDAILLAQAGGSTATGGLLSISSGRFYIENTDATGADTNLVVTQSGNVILNPNGGLGVGNGLNDTNGVAYGNLGAFSLDRFHDGGFDSLSLGGKYFPGGSPVPFGGNVAFRGKINLNVRGDLRLATGGVVTADDTVRITASYLMIGQDFRPPANPDDAAYQPFRKIQAGNPSAHNLSPTTGNGSLDLAADLIDVGTLSLQNIARTNLVARGGDIRGNGTLSVAGDLTLSASKIYPTSLGSFDIFAYDHAGISGSVTIKTSGKSDEIPLSAGGSLAIYSSIINQNGILRAPMGQIILGWDGTDLDPTDTDIDSPFDDIAGTTINAPVTGKLTLGNDSLTSVSAATKKGDPSWTAPFGISSDGRTWIDPRGVNVTLGGLPGKSVSISGSDVNMGSGAVVDIRGGSELLASRWLAGIGGSVNLLGSSFGAWSGEEYQAGDLVSYGGETWSARVRHSGQTPTVGVYWSKVAESFAIIPSASLAFAPYNSFNTGPNAEALGRAEWSGRDPGYVDPNLAVGDTITLEGSKGLQAGTYTLLPRRYALLPGAFLVTPVSSGGTGTVTKADGSSLVSGYLGNHFNGPDTATAERSRYEIASAKVIADRVQYETYSATKFLGAAAKEQGLVNPQELPSDAGYAAFHGNSGLRLAGKLRTESPGLGATVDISSFAAIGLIGGSSQSTAGGVVLQTSVLTSWGADSLLIGGIRRSNAEGVTSLEIRTNSLTLDNPGGSLTAVDVVLASNEILTVKGGSSVTAAGNSNFTADALTVSGDGALLRTSADAEAVTTRTGFTGATSALMEIGSGATIGGESVILDSTYGTRLASNIKLSAGQLTLGSGQISVVFDDASGALTGSVVDPHLVLAGATLDQALTASDLTLRSYRSIDLYGSGVLGREGLEHLTLTASGIRGYESSGGKVVISASEVLFENSTNSLALAAPANATGNLEVVAGTVRLGDNGFAVTGYQDLVLESTQGLVFQGKGAFSTTANLQVLAPLVYGEAGAAYSITSSQAMALDRSAGIPSSSGALGASLTLQAASVEANTDVLLPSGQLTLRATSGNVRVGGKLSVEGTRKAFNDLIRYSDAGTITLESQNGDVLLSADGTLAVAAPERGGNAGTVNVLATKGMFSAAGTLQGQAAANFRSGTFLLDVGSLQTSEDGSLAGINSSLNAGGFAASRNFRIRNGDVMIDHGIRSHEFSLSADNGDIIVTGKIDASGRTGGKISLSAHGDLILENGSELTVAATGFDSAGKGGSILLEAGTQRDGVANPSGLLDLRSGATLDLSVSDYVAGTYTTPGSSAFEGKFTGTLHLRAPRTPANDDLQIASIQSTVTGASSVVAEGFKVYSPAGGVLNIALRNLINTDAISFLGAAGIGNANEVAMRGKLLNGATPGLDSLLVLAPGVEILNRTGDLTLGLANNSATGTTISEALAVADWDLSTFRYGSRGAAGVLTLRANGDLVFNNTLSDGFTPVTANADTGFSTMWLAPLAKISSSLPVNTQSWSYRLTAGADTNSSNFRGVLGSDFLGGKGSVLVGEFYPAVPNTITSGGNAGIGPDGQTADSIRITTPTINTNRGNRFEVIRTGTGDITISAGRDVQLRNQFSTIYTAGVALPDPTSVYNANDFVVPILPRTVNTHPSQNAGGGFTLGAIQQLYQAAWSMAGGSIAISAQSNIGRYTLVNGILTADSSRQMPTNWLFRRGYVDPTTGLFANNGGFGTSPNPDFQGVFNINDQATSTTWWVDYSNFFQGIGTLGGGNIELAAGNDIINVDAVAPTNARMPGRKKNPDFGVVAGASEYLTVAPDADRLVEWGGGDVAVRAGRDLSGGVYYVEKGSGSLFAGGEITTNAARTPSLGILTGTPAGSPDSWLPTTLFVGKSRFDVSAGGDILLGSTTNPFFLPQGLNNKFWYKTFFNTFSADAGANVASYGGSVTHRIGLKSWYDQSLFNTVGSSTAARYQPWLRLNEIDLGEFSSVFNLNAPLFRSTSFAGDVNLVNSMVLAPSATGNLELAAAGSIIGSSSVINISDAPTSSIPGIAKPLASQSVSGRGAVAADMQRDVDVLLNVNAALDETGSFIGEKGTSQVQSALHGSSLLHKNDLNPVRIYAAGGDILGLTLFAPKAARVIAGQDITAISFYIQNLSVEDITLISAGRDLVPFNSNAQVGVISSVAGDIQINGPGTLEVLSGRNLDLGNGPNNIDGTGVGITSIGNRRNPNLPFRGADIIAMAGVTAADGDGPAEGLSLSSLDFDAFIDEYLQNPEKFDSAYRDKLGEEFEDLTAEQQAIVAFEKFYAVLGAAGDEASKTGSYKSGYDAIKSLFGKAKPAGEIFTRAREIRTSTGGAISLAVPGGGITMASQIFGNPLTPPGIVTEYGGSVSTFTDGSVEIGQARIFTLRGGDITMWSSNGNIAAGTSPRTVVTAPPTRVVVDVTSADIQTDLGGLATGGGIGVLAAVEGVEPGDVYLIAPEGFVDAGDAGIQATGNLTIASPVVLNAANTSSGGTSNGTSAPASSTPSAATVTSASNSAAASTAATKPPIQEQSEAPKAEPESLSVITVEVIGYGGGGSTEEEDEEDEDEEGVN